MDNQWGKGMGLWGLEEREYSRATALKKYRRTIARARRPTCGVCARRVLLVQEEAPPLWVLQLQAHLRLPGQCLYQVTVPEYGDGCVNEIHDSSKNTRVFSV